MPSNEAISAVFAVALAATVLIGIMLLVKWASQALAMLARLFRYGRLSYHGGFVNLRTGRTTSLPVDPVVWQRMKTWSSEPKSAKSTLGR